MEINEALDHKPTKTPSQSWVLFWQLMTQQKSWRCYTNKDWDSEVWELMAKRFINSHAKNPSILAVGILSSSPYEVWYFAFDADEAIPQNIRNTTGKIALYTNGAIVELISPLKKDLYLFVDDATADLWAYPQEKYIYPSDHFVPKEIRNV